MHKNTRAIYPGTFDPLTKGHLDIIRRSANMFDEIIIAIGDNSDKSPMFSVAERAQMIKKATKDIPGITVVTFKSLLVDLSKDLDTNIIIRGIRTPTDLEYESQMSYANSALKKDLETIYLIPRLDYSYISSSVVRTILNFDGPIDHLVPASILEDVEKKRIGKN